MTTDPDRIEKKVFLGATRSRVWRAVSDATEFGSWFGVAFDGPFVAGERLTGRIVPTTVDAEVAAMQKLHEGTPFEFTVETLEPERFFSFRWHPFAIDPTRDYSHEKTTLVTFALDVEDHGTLLTITESGFDEIPLERRAKAFAANDGGWTHQASLIQKYLGHAG